MPNKGKTVSNTKKLRQQSGSLRARNQRRTASGRSLAYDNIRSDRARTVGANLASSKDVLGKFAAEYTGVNPYDGLDLGDAAAAALLIPGGIGRVGAGLVRAGIKLLPKAVRIGAAAGRVSRRAAKTAKLAEFRAGVADDMARAAQENIRIGRNDRVSTGYVNNYTSRGHGPFDEHLGYDVTRREWGGGERVGERMVRAGTATRVPVQGGYKYVNKWADDLIQRGESGYLQAQAEMQRAVNAGRAAGGRLTPAGARREITSRLRAVQNARKAR